MTESHDPKRVAASEEFRLTAATNVAALGETQVSARLSLITKPSSALVEEDEHKFSGITPFFLILKTEIHNQLGYLSVGVNVDGNWRLGLDVAGTGAALQDDRQTSKAARVQT